MPDDSPAALVVADQSNEACATGCKDAGLATTEVRFGVVENADATVVGRDCIAASSGSRIGSITSLPSAGVGAGAGANSKLSPKLTAPDVPCGAGPRLITRGRVYP